MESLSPAIYYSCMPYCNRPIVLYINDLMSLLLQPTIYIYKIQFKNRYNWWEGFDHMNGVGGPPHAFLYVRACMCVCMCAWLHAWVRACVHAQNVYL